MSTGSAGPRPAYSSFSWAYDSIVEGATEPRLRFIRAALVERGVAAGARVLDAGCGTGSYAVGLAASGFEVVGVDRAAELLTVARSRRVAAATFVQTDLIADELPRDFDAILCRGALTEILDVADRQRVLSKLGDACRPGGVLLLDVRSWEATQGAAQGQACLRGTFETERGPVFFEQVVRGVDDERRRLLLREVHQRDGERREHDVSVVCWTREELEQALDAAGFEAIELFGGYDERVEVGATPFFVVVAQRRR